MSDNNSKGPIISAIIGATFFAVPYIVLSTPLLPSIGIAAAAYGAGNLLFSSRVRDVNLTVDEIKDVKVIISNAKKQNEKITSMIKKIDDLNTRNEIEEITQTVSKIIEGVEKNPAKYDNSRNFFNYYLPMTLKIIEEYDTIENQGLDNSDVKKFMKSAEDMIRKINKSFKEQLSNLYQTNIIDTDAEMKVFESMLNLDGFNDNDNFNIKGGN